MRRTVVAMSCILVALAACASKPPSEYDVVLKRPKPSSDEARRQECTWLETSLDRQKSLARYIATTATYPTTALAEQDATLRNMAVLESRARQIDCQAAQARGPFDDCFARCKQYTDRSGGQCFDACNK